jgi:putative glutamine amidotransferase
MLISIRVALAIRNEAKAAPYQRALREAGLDPVTFAPNSGAALDQVGGLVLTGGTDVDPALYNAVRAPETDQPDRERDDYESNLLRIALVRDLAVLAICRGSQLFNVVCGGTLIQHLSNSEKHKQRTGGVPVHDVVLEGRLAGIFETQQMRVNSRHHQAMDRLGEGLIVTARSTDNKVIEGFALPAARFALAVQWHPEDMADDERQARLFNAFAAAAMPG